MSHSNLHLLLLYRILVYYAAYSFSLDFYWSEFALYGLVNVAFVVICLLACSEIPSSVSS